MAEPGKNESSPISAPNRFPKKGDENVIEGVVVNQQREPSQKPEVKVMTPAEKRLAELRQQEANLELEERLSRNQGTDFRAMYNDAKIKEELGRVREQINSQSKFVAEQKPQLNSSNIFSPENVAKNVNNRSALKFRPPTKKEYRDLWEDEEKTSENIFGKPGEYGMDKVRTQLGNETPLPVPKLRESAEDLWKDEEKDPKDMNLREVYAAAREGEDELERLQRELVDFYVDRFKGNPVDEGKLLVIRHEGNLLNNRFDLLEKRRAELEPERTGFTTSEDEKDVYEIEGKKVRKIKILQ